ncbi:MAG TPA: hypothetical protein EYG78_06895 [Sulfurovum sp.]|nr:hypothetical protein [Sulfurovum sp.]
MATAREIEEILGISSRTIESWSSTRDDKYLLSKFLKSYSKLDLKSRIERILEEEEIMILDKQKFFEKIRDNFQRFFPDVLASEISDSKIGVDTRTGMSDLVIKTRSTIYFLDETSQLPSKNIISKRCKKLLSTIHNSNNQYFDGISKINCIYITAKKGAGKGMTIKVDDSLDYVVTAIDIDTVAKELYSQERIILR